MARSATNRTTPPHLAKPELRYATADETDAFFAATLRGFYEDYQRELWAGAQHGVFEPDRNFGFAVDGRWVSTCGAYSRVITVPGGAVPVAAITFVTVSPAYRRRGLLRAMMTEQLTDIVRRGREPIALLWASEAVIYGRFGYGQATPRLRLSGATRDTAFQPGISLGDGSVGEVERDEGIAAITALHRRFLPDRPGALNRDERWRTVRWYDPEPWRHGASALRFLLHYDRAGRPDGYAVFRTKEERFNEVEVRIEELDSADPAGHAALWRFLLDLDLVRTFAKRDAAADDPLRFMLADYRALKAEPVDGTYLRIVDLPRALSARTYAADADLVIGIDDPVLPANAGAYRLQLSSAGATVTKARRRPDVSMNVRELGSIYLGGVSPHTLARAGLIAERTPGSVDALALAFASPRAPFCPDGF